jgi:hypothetical protein
VSENRPPWCDLFLKELRRQGMKYAQCNVKLAAELAGVGREWAHRYRHSPNGEAFRIEWDTIVLEARRLHSIRHR